LLPLICVPGKTALPSTTTVVMEAHESLNESAAAATVAGNDCDGPRAASSCETATRPAAPQANARVRAARSKTSGALLARSLRQAHRLRSFFSLLPSLDAGQPGMGQQRQGDVALPTVPEAHFILIQARLPFGLFDALLDGVARGGHLHQGLKRGLGWSRGQVIGQLVRRAGRATRE
jgi:hypothetical protein